MEIELVHFHGLENFKRASQRCKCRSRMSYLYKILMMSSRGDHFMDHLNSIVDLHLISIYYIYGSTSFTYSIIFHTYLTCFEKDALTFA